MPADGVHSGDYVDSVVDALVIDAFVVANAAS